MNKLYASPKAALDGLLRDGMTIMSGGFGLVGNPESLIHRQETAVAVDQRKADWQHFKQDLNIRRAGEAWPVPIEQ